MKDKFLILIYGCLLFAACQSEQVASFDTVNSFFQKEKNDLEAVANYLEEQSGQQYDFAFIDISEGAFRLTLGAEGEQESKRLENSSIDAALQDLLKNKKCYSIFKEGEVVYFMLKGNKKHGVESASGLVKNLSGLEPEIELSWVSEYQLKSLNENWYYFQY
ncbi:MAG: hypothetical protein MI974_12000 [Chitinophagales bacterium]|nr:hypothetical protein [Chitinophagales bacterium]